MALIIGIVNLNIIITTGMTMTITICPQMVTKETNEMRTKKSITVCAISLLETVKEQMTTQILCYIQQPMN